MSSSDSNSFQSALDSAAVFSLSGRTHIEVTGADRASFLHNFCTNHIKGLEVGHGCEAFFTNIKGRILFYGLVYCSPESLWIETEPGLGTALISHLDRYLITEDVQLIDRSGELSQLYISGPSSSEWLSWRLGGEVESLPSPGQMTCEGVLIRRFSFGSAAGYSLVGPVPELEGLKKKLTSQGAVELPSQWFEPLRIEAGSPKSGVDLTEDHLAQEANRTPHAISFVKGCYLGQEPIARLDALGHVNRLFCRVISDAPIDLPVGTEVYPTVESTKPAGVLTSTAVWPPTGQLIGLGMLRREITGDGTACYLGPDRTAARVRGFSGAS